MKKYYFLPIFIIVFLSLSCKKDGADMVVKNATIWTGDSTQTQAEAIAIKNDKIVFVGKNDGIEKFIDTKTQVIDAQGMMLTPGFFDCHVHITWGGATLTTLQLGKVNDKKVFIQKIAEYAKTLPKGQWITGAIYDNTLWDGEPPQAAWIDSVTKDNPLVIRRQEGHVSFGNSLAMKAAKVENSKNIEGGVIERDKNGKPTGIFKDNAQDLLLNAIPAISDEQRDKYILAAMDLFASNGLTTVDNMGEWQDIPSLKRLEKEGKSKTRVNSNVPLNTWAKLSDEVSKNGTGDNWVRIGGLKGFVDGALGSHTAAMLEPFTDNPKDKGIFITPLDSIYYFVSNADKKGLHVMVHAIGDNAIRQQLTIFERVAKENGAKDRRFRIEHAQHLAPQDIPRFAQLKIIPSMQPYHAIDDGRWAEKVLGHERCKTTYAFKSLIDSGVKPAFGSDWFVAPPSPLYGIYAAVTRRTLDDKNPNGWFPEQKITVEQALKGYTNDAAYASFDEKERGTLAVGKLADFVMIDQDIRKIAPEKIRDAKIMLTVVGGKVMYKK